MQHLSKAKAKKRFHNISTNNTVIKESNGGDIFEFHLHGHGICLADIKEGSVKLNNCGYRTQTTKRRMNQILEELESTWEVYQVQGEWFVRCFSTGNILDFFNNMVLPIDNSQAHNTFEFSPKPKSIFQNIVEEIDLS